MKKVLLADGAGFTRFFAIFAVLGTLLFLPSSSLAQTRYDLTFIGLPQGSVDLSLYIGLDRLLKPEVAGQILRITATPPLTQPRSVRLTISASSTGSRVNECNGQIATATLAFSLIGSGRDINASAFTRGSNMLSLPIPYTNQRCVDALADRLKDGLTALPPGLYQIGGVLNDASTGALLATGSHTIVIGGGSTNEAILNLITPLNGEFVPSTGSVVFNFENSIPGRLLAFEHSSLSQSQDDATRDLNSPLKVLDIAVTARGNNQITATYPGVALRGWMAGKKYSWLFLGESSSLPPEVRRSPVWSFTVLPNDPVLAQLVAALSSAPDPLGSTFSNLINSGYTLAFSGSNPIYIQDGETGTPRVIDISDVLALLAELSRRNVRFEAVVTQ